MPGSRIEVYRQAGEVKLSLPFKGLGIKAPKPGDVWGINFSRMDQPGKLDMDLMQNSSWVSIGYVGDLFRTGDLWEHLVFADKGGTDSASARKAMDATLGNTEKAVISQPYSGSCNSDGFAVQWCIDRLDNRNEKAKLLFVISDGQPSGPCNGMGAGQAEHSVSGDHPRRLCAWRYYLYTRVNR